MCLDVRVVCECGSKTVQFHLRDNVMVPKVISRLFCPHCPGHDLFDPSSMINDNGWIIDYDMEIARTISAQRLGLAAERVTPESLFDTGYACWLEMYPGEKEDIFQQKQEMKALLQISQKDYLTAIHSWNIGRVKRLKDAGWRRAQVT